MEFVIALVVGVLLALLIAWPWGEGAADWEWSAFLFFFLILFFAAWAGGLWLVPFGPVVGGVYWAPIVVVAIIVALLLLALPPTRPVRRRRSGRTDVVEVPEEEAATAVAFGVFFWVFIAFLIVAILAAYAVA